MHTLSSEWTYSPKGALSEKPAAAFMADLPYPLLGSRVAFRAAPFSAVRSLRHI